jgi:hypothetical protein
MRRLSALVVSIFAFNLLCSPTQAEENGNAGSIRGMLVDGNSQRIMPGEAVVFLCDAESGLPIMPETKKPLDLEHIDEATYAFDGFWHAVTNSDSSFEFKDVPAGTYRLFAQSWAGIRGMPRGLPPDRDDLRPEPSDTIILHGSSEQVVVLAGETTAAHVKQPGLGVQHILCDPEEEHNYVLISFNPTLGDHVLSVAGWDKNFLTGVVGLTRMEVPHLTIIGLPDDKEVHVSLFNYDNNPGSGGASFVPGQQATVRLPIYATWSDGKYEPPPRLVKLTAHLEHSDAKLEELLPAERGKVKAYFDYLWQHGHEQIEVPGYGPARVVDIAAADSYRSLRKSHAARLERLRQQNSKPE